MIILHRFVADFIGDTNFLTGDLTQGGTLRLSSGQTLETGRTDVSGKVTLAVRPEHARLTSPGDGLLKGTLSDIVYFGTDTHFHVALEDGTMFVLRQQNAPDTQSGHARGDSVGVTFPANVAQVLKD